MSQMMKGKLWIVLGALLVLMSCQSQSENETVQDERSRATPVKLFKVKKGEISEKLFYTGIIKPRKNINITPEVGGKIAQIYVEEGDRVQKGQLLAALETRSFQLQLEKAQASLAVARANYKDSQKNMERMERLIKEKAISDKQYEKVKLGFESAEAQLEQAKAAVNLAKYRLEASQMKAPFDGMVASRNAEEGDVINPTMGALSPQSGVLTLMDYSGVKISLEVSNQNIGHIRKGQPAVLRMDAFPERGFKGQVSMVNQTANPATKKFKVEIRVDNPDLTLKPNTFGEVIIKVNTHEQALVIPQQAILENKYVFLARDNQAQRQEVILGLQNTEMVEVLKGIQEGDLVVIEGNYGLKDGALVEVQEVKK
ncbi:efflux RND transporter periplasmic adaptor subunit [bacterium]|nr:efflux RND transporter periplasmic adaptor subunit [bacterium]